MAVVMYDGSPDERKQLQRDRVEKGTFNVLVTHYDLVMRDKAALRKVCILNCMALASARGAHGRQACGLAPWLNNNYRFASQCQVHTQRVLI